MRSRADKQGGLAFTGDLKPILARIMAAAGIEPVLREVSPEICAAFEADRVTIYLVNEDRTLIVSKVKIGLDSHEDLKLPISAEHSIAGYVALHKRLVNIADVYDLAELNAFDPPVYFLREVDKATGYKTRQVLAAPLISNAASGDVIGVVQLINTVSGNPFPKSAEEKITALCKALALSLEQPEKTIHMLPGPAKAKYDYLIIDGVITAAELDLAIRRARVKGTDVEQILADEFQVVPAVLGLALSKWFGLPYEPFVPGRTRPTELLKSLKRRFVKSHLWVPIEEDAEGIVVLSTDPERVINSHIANQVFPRKKITFRVCGNSEFGATLEQFYGSEDTPASIDTIIRRMGDDAADLRGDAEEKAESDSVVVQLVNKMIIEAHKMKASDIHVEPRHGKARTRVRFRVDGSLLGYTEIPAAYHDKLVARLKIMADLDISNKREPQDGKITFKQFHSSLDIELRVATIPTSGGKEDVVLRVLSSGTPVPLDQLCLSQHNLETVKSLVSRPYGLFLVCGPTGSGKTTTLHSVIDVINTSETKIWTAEDPVEITNDSLRQVQINPRADFTFARAMRAFLRADPDVIMVGEMRDKETAAIGIEASLTGHRVFATIHTNSASESIVRLLDMGMDPFNFSDALMGILAQRLAKRLCAKCKKPHEATPDEVELMLSEYVRDLAEIERFRSNPKAARESIHADWVKRYGYDQGRFITYVPAGCDACRGTGYIGRIALHELMVASETIKKNIQEHARINVLARNAMNEGMRSLKQDGIQKVLQGLTTLHAVRAVCIN